jgi:hypothetical protein
MSTPRSRPGAELTPSVGYAGTVSIALRVVERKRSEWLEEIRPWCCLRMDMFIANGPGTR